MYYQKVTSSLQEQTCIVEYGAICSDGGPLILPVHHTSTLDLEHGELILYFEKCRSHYISYSGPL